MCLLLLHIFMYIGVVLSRRRPNDGNIVGEGLRVKRERRRVVHDGRNRKTPRPYTVRG